MMSLKMVFVQRNSFLVVLVLVLVTLAASQLISSGGGVRGPVETNAKSQETLDISPDCMYDSTDFKVMADAVERSLNFFEQNVDRLVLDAAVGTRSLEAQLKGILRGHPNLPQIILQYVRYLADKAESLSNRITLAIAKSHKITYTEKKHTLPWVTTEGLWDWPINGVWEPMSIMESYEPASGLNASKILQQSKETIEEAQSDTCIYQVFNCQSQETSETCRKLFFVQEQSLYSLTHQVIYTLFAKKKQCYKAIGSDELRHYQEKLCGKVWLEANAISQVGFSSSFADLFVEQVAICGMTGYPNFFRRDWLMQILGWQSQRKSGCFLDTRVQPSIPPTSLAMLVNLYHRNQEKFKEIMNQHFDQHKYANKAASRQKRSDAFLKQGNRESCSVHFTAVGITALGMHMRYFMDTCLVGKN